MKTYTLADVDFFVNTPRTETIEDIIERRAHERREHERLTRDRRKRQTRMMFLEHVEKYCAKKSRKRS